MAKRKRELMAWATVSLLTGYVRIESNRRRLTTRTGSLIGPFRINLRWLAESDPVLDAQKRLAAERRKGA